MSDLDGYRHLLVEREADGYVAVVVLDRPDALNAINTAMGEDLVTCFGRINADPSVRAVVLTGAGERAFSAGADLKERQGMTDDAWRAQHVVFETAAARILHCPVPVVAAIEGYAMGGGWEIALATDFMVAGETAVFAFPETSLGIFPGLVGTQLLPRAVGAPLARELIYSGRRMAAPEAREAGMLNHLVPAGQARAKAVEIATAISRNGPLAVRQVKKAISYGVDPGLDAGIALALEAYNVCIAGEDRREGITAFNERRAPRWTGR
jgi:enoyl-CoA hydratase/carnithine racemase